MLNARGLTFDDIDCVIAMAWADKSPFEAIQQRFGLPHREVIELMKKEMKWSAYQKWQRFIVESI